MAHTKPPNGIPVNLTTLMGRLDAYEHFKEAIQGFRSFNQSSSRLLVKKLPSELIVLIEREVLAELFDIAADNWSTKAEVLCYEDRCKPPTFVDEEEARLCEEELRWLISRNPSTNICTAEPRGIYFRMTKNGQHCCVHCRPSAFDLRYCKCALHREITMEEILARSHEVHRNDHNEISITWWQQAFRYFYDGHADEVLRQDFGIEVWVRHGALSYDQSIRLMESTNEKYNAPPERAAIAYLVPSKRANPTHGPQPVNRAMRFLQLERFIDLEFTSSFLLGP